MKYDTAKSDIFVAFQFLILNLLKELFFTFVFLHKIVYKSVKNCHRHQLNENKYNYVLLNSKFDPKSWKISSWRALNIQLPGVHIPIKVIIT